MTKQEAIVIETYTGICMLTGDDRKLAYEYAEKLLVIRYIRMNFQSMLIS